MRPEEIKASEERKTSEERKAPEEINVPGEGRASGKRKAPKIIGVTGGVGAGKSRILNILKERHHAQVLLADQVAAELEEPGQEGLLLLVRRFGDGILGKDGRLDRPAFAERIFQDPKSLSQVNSILHPLAWKAIQERIAKLSENPDVDWIVVEAALFQEESKKICDALWFVDATQENRIRRLMENRGYSREKCLNIMQNQPCREEFLVLADEVIDNNRTVKEAEEQVARLLEKETGKESVGEYPCDL